MILLIDNYDSFTYNVYQSIAARGVPVQVVRNDQCSLDDIEKLQPDGIILSPGPGRPAQAGLCLSLVQALSGKYPILGVCLGHQVIGEAFGATVVIHEDIVHGKSSLVFHQRKGLYQHMPLPFYAGRYHSLVLKKDTIQSPLIINAESETGVVMGIQHQAHPTFGVQFHPESILTEEGDALLDAFIHVCQCVRSVA